MEELKPIQSVEEIPEECLDDFEMLNEFLLESGYEVARIEYIN